MEKAKKDLSININDCSNMSFEQSFELIQEIIGKKELQKAFNIETFYPSPICRNTNTKWTQTIKIIGVNPRLTKTFWGIVKYALSFPEKGIHIMPLFETGDGSLYVQNSWDLNSNFLDSDLIKLGYENPEKQLKLITNILHAMGKIVGFDALCHVDNFSKITLLNPRFFEWAKLNDDKTSQICPPRIDFNILYKEVEETIVNHIGAPENLFELSEKERERIIFPSEIDEFEIRMDLRKAVRKMGFEPLPVVEHAPSRPIVFEKIERRGNEDWAVFRVENKSPDAKIFGATTPYKLYKMDDCGYPIKNQIETKTWDYFAQKIYDFQKEYNFDFLRADMAHNQISHAHQESEKDYDCPELWAYVKEKIQKDKPYFATMAEAFLNTYYIDGIGDMINKKFDIVLGNMNFKHLNQEFVNFTDDFLNPFRENFNFYPCMTIYTNDGDLPCHNTFCPSNEQNIARAFISLFLNLPSYMGMGFEVRDLNPNEDCKYSHRYIKLWENEYEFGRNEVFLEKLTQLRIFYQKMKKVIDSKELHLFRSSNELSLSWIYGEAKPEFLFIINLNESQNDIFIPKISGDLKVIFTNSDNTAIDVVENGIKINRLGAWEYTVCEFC